MRIQINIIIRHPIKQIQGLRRPCKFSMRRRLGEMIIIIIRNRGWISLVHASLPPAQTPPSPLTNLIQFFSWKNWGRKKWKCKAKSITIEPKCPPQIQKVICRYTIWTCPASIKMTLKLTIIINNHPPPPLHLGSKPHPLVAVVDWARINMIYRSIYQAIHINLIQSKRGISGWSCLIFNTTKCVKKW